MPKQRVHHGVQLRNVRRVPGQAPIRREGSTETEVRQSAAVLASAAYECPGVKRGEILSYQVKSRTCMQGGKSSSSRSCFDTLLDFLAEGGGGGGEGGFPPAPSSPLPLSRSCPPPRPSWKEKCIRISTCAERKGARDQTGTQVCAAFPSPSESDAEPRRTIRSRTGERRRSTTAVPFTMTPRRGGWHTPPLHDATTFPFRARTSPPK